MAKKHCRSGVGDTFLSYGVVASLTLGSHCMSKLYNILAGFSFYLHYSFWKNIFKIVCAFPTYIYRSEGPSQVFLIVIVWMIAALRDLSREERKKVVLSYDNMCHLDNLKVAKKPLPLPGDLSHMWSDVGKIIDI